jgi:beta-lactam-binding protein with PASTA domain
MVRRGGLAALVGLMLLPAVSNARPVDGSTAYAARTVKVPSLHCRRLDRAEDMLHTRGLKVRERGGGIFGILVKSNWVVTGQSPRAGTRVHRGARVTVYVDRGC